MSKTRQMEILVGAFMAAGFVALFFLAMQVSNLGTVHTGDSYQVTGPLRQYRWAQGQIAGHHGGGRGRPCVDIYYDPEDFRAVAVLGIYAHYNRIPDDTFAKILTAGLLGEQYVGLDPGGSEDILKEGSEIAVTQSALVLEEVIGQFIYGKAQEGVN